MSTITSKPKGKERAFRSSFPLPLLSLLGSLIVILQLVFSLVFVLVTVEVYHLLLPVVYAIANAPLRNVEIHLSPLLIPLVDLPEVAGPIGGLLDGARPTDERIVLFLVVKVRERRTRLVFGRSGGAGHGS
jgi:hypothetical protein